MTRPRGRPKKLPDKAQKRIDEVIDGVTDAVMRGKLPPVDGTENREEDCGSVKRAPTKFVFVSNLAGNDSRAEQALRQPKTSIYQQHAQPDDK